MSLRRLAGVAVGACLLALAARAAEERRVTLAELLSHSDHALGVRHAEAELDASVRALDRSLAVGGWTVSGGAGYGSVRNIVDERRALTYQAAQAHVGLSYPLLGSSEKFDREAGAAGGLMGEKRARLETARNTAAAEIEVAYANYWAAQEGQLLVLAFLGTEENLYSRMRRRAESRLMLKSELFELEAGYASARVTLEQLRREQDAARMRLEQLSGSALAGMQAHSIQLAATGVVVSDLSVQKHPELQALRSRTEALESQLKHIDWYGVEAAFSLTANAVRDSALGETGGTGFAGFNITAPFGWGAAQRNEQLRLEAELQAARLQQQIRLQELGAEAGQRRRQSEAASAKSEVLARSSRAAAEALRESYLRGQSLQSEGIEKLSLRLRDYYRAAMEELSVQQAAWMASIEWRKVGGLVAIVPPRQEPGPSLGARLSEPIARVALQLKSPASTPRSSNDQPSPETSPAQAPGTAPRFTKLSMQLAPVGRPLPPSPRMAVYVWDSAAFIHQSEQDPAYLWGSLAQASMSRVLLSLNGEQISAAAEDDSSLRAFLQNARRQNIPVELLLGEPSWIEPQNRVKLIQILKSLNGLPFDGLHLDIEPDQVYPQPLNRAQFDAWISTMAEAARHSEWPVAVSIHPRYFSDQPYASWRLAPRLAEAGIRNVTLMIYSSNPGQVAARATAIAAAAPGLNFQVAQSVEPGLSRDESHANKTRQQFGRTMQQLEGLLTVQPNIRGLAVQAWADLKRMKYESEIR